MRDHLEQHCPIARSSAEWQFVLGTNGDGKWQALRSARWRGLSPDDFKKTYEALLDDQLPMGLPAQRASAATTFDWLSGFLGAGAAGSAITPGGQAAAPFVGVAAAGAWGLGKLSGLGEDMQLKSKMNALRAKIPNLVQSY